MHMFGADAGFMGGHGIVGGQAGLALGMAWAIHYRGGDQVCVCFLGDAAVNQGGFHESMNMAAIWGLPVIYVVENNAYGMGTKFTRMSETQMVQKAASHGVPATVVNAEDVLATYAHFAGLIEIVRQGGGPQFVDVECYRFKGHSMSDPVSGTYRSKEEVDERAENSDPIKYLRDRMFSAALLTGEELEAIDQEVRGIVDAAVEFAEAAPEPEVETLYKNVYSEINPHGRLFFDGRGQ